MTVIYRKETDVLVIHSRSLKGGGTPKNGRGLADYTVVDEKNIYALPDSLSLEEGALVEPTTVAVQAVKEGDLQSGQKVAVFGAGPIGLLTIMAAKAVGASKIMVFDLSADRLKRRKK